MELSTRPENFIGPPEIWEKAEAALKNVLDDKKIVYKINPGRRRLLRAENRFSCQGLPEPKLAMRDGSTRFS